MSGWQGYVDNLTKSGLSGAGLYGQQGGGVWAQKFAKPPTQPEINAVLAAFKTPASCLWAGDKYMFTSNPDGVLSFKKGPIGLVAAQSKTAVIVATVPDSLPQPAAVNAVLNMANYLKSLGY